MIFTRCNNLDTVRKKGTKTVPLGHYLSVGNKVSQGVLFQYPNDPGVIFVDYYETKSTPVKKG